MKRYILFLLWIIVPAAQEAASHNHLPAALPSSINIYGERGTIAITEKIDLRSEDPITLMSYEQHIEEMAKRQLPWILAAFWWQDSDGSLARDYADAVSLNQWRLNEKYGIKKHLHPTNEQPIASVEYFLFDIIDEELSIEKLGTEQQLSSDTLLQHIFKVLENPNLKKKNLRVELRAISQQYQERNDQTHALIWLTKSILLGSLHSAQKLAIQYCDDGEYEKALHLWRAFSQSTDRCNKAYKYYGLGHIYNSQKNYAQAIKNYEKAFQTLTDEQLSDLVHSALNILHLRSRHHHECNAIDNDTLRACAQVAVNNTHAISKRTKKSSTYKTAMQMARKLVDQE